MFTLFLTLMIAIGPNDEVGLMVTTIPNMTQAACMDAKDKATFQASFPLPVVGGSAECVPEA